MTDQEDSSNFRRWLIGKLSKARWPAYGADADVSALARRLGVQPDVLAEARDAMRLRQSKERAGRRRIGMPRARDGKAARHMVFLEPPAEVYRDWCAYRDRRHLTNSTLLRSVIHHVLKLEWQPVWLHSGRKSWYYRGRWLAQKSIRDHVSRMKTDIREPCYLALTERALHTGVSASAIARWAVVYLLDGGLEREKTLWIVSGIEALYNDARDYCTTPVLTKENAHGHFKAS